jgi:hypothetical protein
MAPAISDTTGGVLNETTNTVHKHKAGAGEFETECGLTRHVESRTLQRVLITEVVTSKRTNRCGRCFPEAGSY